MKKWIGIFLLALMVAACGGGNNASGSSDGDGDGCAAEEAPELKGLEGDARKAMEEALALRKEMKDWVAEVKGASDEDREAKKAEWKDRFDNLGKSYGDLRDKVRELEEETQKKFEAILEEMDKMGEEAEELIGE